MRLRTWNGWPAVASAAMANALLLLMLAVQPDREVPTFLVQLIVVALVAGSAYLLDDVAKAVTDVVPTSLLRRRSVIVMQGLVVMAVGWLVTVTLLRWWSGSTLPASLAWEVAGLSCTVVAASALVSLAGEDEPGNMVATALALIVIGTLLVQPLIDAQLLATSTSDPVHARWWSLLIVFAVAVFVLATTACCRRQAVGWRCQLKN